jgi:hypothetical protein
VESNPAPSDILVPLRVYVSEATALPWLILRVGLAVTLETIGLGGGWHAIHFSARTDSDIAQLIAIRAGLGIGFDTWRWRGRRLSS